MPPEEDPGPDGPEARRVRFAQPSSTPSPGFSIHTSPFAALPPRPPSPGAAAATAAAGSAAAGPEPDTMRRPRPSSRVVDALQSRGSRAVQALQSAAVSAVRLGHTQGSRREALDDPFSRYSRTIRCCCRPLQELARLAGPRLPAEC